MPALCDGLGEIAASVPVTLRHRSTQAAGDVSAPTLARELAIEVWTRAGQRRRQMLAPAGARLPGKFTCQCRTTDQCGRIVVPLWEENRMLRQIVVDELDPRLPVGCPVEVELQGGLGNVEAGIQDGNVVLTHTCGNASRVRVARTI